MGIGPGKGLNGDGLGILLLDLVLDHLFGLGFEWFLVLWIRLL